MRVGDRVIEETFHGTDADGSLDGRSLSVRDVADGRWRQTRVDSNGAYPDFVGVEVDGRIAFQRDAIVDGAARDAAERAKIIELPRRVSGDGPD